MLPMLTIATAAASDHRGGERRYEVRDSERLGARPQDARFGRAASVPAGERLTLASARRSGSAACGEGDTWTSSAAGASLALSETPLLLRLASKRAFRLVLA
jgi:hypothetical protein